MVRLEADFGRCLPDRHEDELPDMASEVMARIAWHESYGSGWKSLR
jgi:hypothetical protein